MTGSNMPAANRMVFQQYKAKEVGAKKGWSLLKKKRDALKARFQAMLNEIVETKKAVSKGLKDAAFSYAKAQWANAGQDISATILERAKDASVTCKLSAENVAGARLPILKLSHDPTKDTNVHTLGLSSGGAMIKACREQYVVALTKVVLLGSFQCSFVTLDEEIKMTGRRVNALEYVIIPKIQAIIAYVKQEMDEQAREEFFRVKKVVQKKRIRVEAEKAKEAALKAAELAAKGLPTGVTSSYDAPSMIQTEKDPDLMF